jgi:hypothetical protein
MNHEKRSNFYPGSIEGPENVPYLSAANAERFSDLGSGCRTDHVNTPVPFAWGTRFLHPVRLERFGLLSDGRLHPP